MHQIKSCHVVKQSVTSGHRDSKNKGLTQKPMRHNCCQSSLTFAVCSLGSSVFGSSLHRSCYRRINASLYRPFRRHIGARIVTSPILSPHRCSDHLCIAHFVVASVLGSSLYRSLRHRVDARIVSASLVSSSPLCTDDVQRGRWLEGGTAAKIYIHVGPLVAHQWQCTCTASRRITPIRRSPDPHTVP